MSACYDDEANSDVRQGASAPETLTSTGDSLTSQKWLIY